MEYIINNKTSVPCMIGTWAWTISKGVFPIIGVTKSEHAKSLKQGINLVLADDEIKKLEELAIESAVKCKGFWE